MSCAPNLSASETVPARIYRSTSKPPPYLRDPLAERRGFVRAARRVKRRLGRVGQLARSHK